MSRSSAQALQVIRQWQSQTDAIREAPDPIGARIALWIISLSLIGVLVSTPFIHIERVVPSSTGKVVSSQPLITIQSLDPAIIKSVNVTEGQQVKKGDLLATLDPTFATADVGQLRQQMYGLDAEIIRAKAELDSHPPVFPANLPADETPYVALQKSLYVQQVGQFDAQVKSYGEKIKTTQATIVKLQGDELRYQAREKISHQVEGMRDTLYKSGASSLLSLLQASDARIELLRTLEGGHNDLIVAQHQLASTEADRDAFIQQWRGTAAQEVVTAQNLRDTAMASLAKASKHEDLVRITAVQDAMVLSVSKLSNGSVLKEGDELMTLSPTDTPLECEVQILARDVGFVRPGDKVVIKVDSLNYFEHGTALGTVRWISEGAFTTEDDNTSVPAYYKARVSIDVQNFTDVPKNFKLTPGLTLEGDITVGHRSVLNYIIGGFMNGMGETMRDQ